jgi:hypothetical protein
MAPELSTAATFVAILGANFYGNIGDLFILEAAVSELLALGMTDVSIYPYPVRYDAYVAIPFITRFGPEVRLARPRFRLRQLVETATRGHHRLQRTMASLYFSGVGGSLQSSMRDHAPWDAAQKVVVLGGELDIPYSMLDSHAYLRQHKKTDGIAYGPVSLVPDRRFKDFLQRRFAEVSEFGVRDPLTAQGLSEIGITNFRLVPDMAFLKYDDAAYRERPTTGRIGLCLSNVWAKRPDAEEYVRTIDRAARRLDLELVVVSTHLREDASLLERLRRAVPEVPLAMPASPAEFTSLVTGLDIFIAGRLHGLLLAMIGGTVILPIAIRPKVVGFCTYIQQDRYLQGKESEDEVADHLKALYADRNAQLAAQRDFCADASEQVRAFLASRLGVERPKMAVPVPVAR